MSFSFSVLGSGSAGNCTVLILETAASGDGLHPGDRKCILIDAGLSPRRTARHLADLGLSIREVSDIVLTHLDTDHFSGGWVKAIEKLNIAVHAHHRHRGATYAAGIPMKRTVLFNRAHRIEHGPLLQPIVFAHDGLGSVGFVIEHDQRRLGFATDLGHVPESLLEEFVDLHALAIESNYDRQMQIDSGRPPFLKRRIMSGAGHLSNEQALAAIEQIESQSRLSTITLLHLSRECNCPDLLRELYIRRAPHLAERLTLSNQHEPTPMTMVAPGMPGRKKPAADRIPASLFSHLHEATAQPVG
jgi:phosphoribosyl 1,2-cyclic phosphodiesterase